MTRLAAVPSPVTPELKPVARRRLTLADISTDTISVREAALILGVGVNHAYDLARRGELPGLLRLGERRLRVSVHVLRRHLIGPV